MPARRKMRRAKKSEFKSPRKGLPDSLNTNGPEQFTTDDGTLWVQEVQIRDGSQTTPKGNFDSIRKLFFNDDDDSPQSTDEESGDVEVRRQFTVNTTEKPVSWFQWLRNKIDVEDGSYNPHKIYTHYVNWTFNANFSVLFLSFLAIFMFSMFIFAVLLKLAGEAQPKCIAVGGEPFDTSNARLADAFALSWTTFTTVGYGMTYTATGVQEPNHGNCTWVVFLCTTESLIGLLYAGMCAAILFGRVSRVQSHAQVLFSNPICIEYGEALHDEHALSSTDGKINGENDMLLNECPTLKFQLVNELANQRNGEIMDATLKVAATNSIGRNDTATRFFKVELKEFEHPFFKRVWQGRHTLNQNSLLLTPAARKRIVENKGYWPREWTKPDKLRSCLNFKELIVTLTGISNISASTVHAYKTYRFADLLVGYEFAPLLYKKIGSSLLKVDMRLLNDVVVQRDLDCENGESTLRSTDDEINQSESIHMSFSKFRTPKKNLQSQDENC